MITNFNMLCLISVVRTKLIVHSILTGRLKYFDSTLKPNLHHLALFMGIKQCRIWKFKSINWILDGMNNKHENKIYL